MGLGQHPRMVGQHDRNLHDYKTYFSSPLYFYPPGDTIVTEVKVVYSESLNTLNETIEYGLKEWNYLNLSSSTSDVDRVSSKKILKDIITKLEPKYGQYHSEDTMTLENSFINIFHWKDKDGVDVELNYFEDLTSPNSNFSGNSRIYLKYKYTEER